MEYKLPPLPFPFAFNSSNGKWAYTENQMRQYAEQAVAPLLAEIERLERKLDHLRLLGVSVDFGDQQG